MWKICAHLCKCVQIFSKTVLSCVNLYKESANHNSSELDVRKKSLGGGLDVYMEKEIEEQEYMRCL